MGFFNNMFGSKEENIKEDEGKKIEIIIDEENKPKNKVVSIENNSVEPTRKLLDMIVNYKPGELERFRELASKLKNIDVLVDHEPLTIHCALNSSVEYFKCLYELGANVFSDTSKESVYLRSTFEKLTSDKLMRPTNEIPSTIKDELIEFILHDDSIYNQKISENSKLVHESLNYSDDFDYTILSGLIRYGNLNLLEYGLKKIDKISFKEHYFDRPLHLINQIAELGKPKNDLRSLIELLVKYGADPSHAVSSCIINGKLNRLKVLLDLGANIGEDGADSLRYLIFSQKCTNMDLIKKIVKSGTDLDKQFNEDNKTLLQRACSTNNATIVKLLLENGANVNGRYYINRLINNEFRVKPDTITLTPLMIATKNNNLEIIRELLKYNPDKNLEDDKGKTVYDYAKKANNQEIIDLINGKSEINDFNIRIIDVDNDTDKIINIQIDLAARLKDRILEERKKLIIDGKRKPTEEEVDDLLRLALEGNVDGINEMLKKGINPNYINKDFPGLGSSNLIHILIMMSGFGAIKETDNKIFDTLFDNGLYVEILRENTMATPLLAAVMNNNDKLAEYLINKGANINTRNIWGNTPLLNAEINNMDNLVKLLTIKGAKKEIEDSLFDDIWQKFVTDEGTDMAGFMQLTTLASSIANENENQNNEPSKIFVEDEKVDTKNKFNKKKTKEFFENCIEDIQNGNLNVIKINLVNYDLDVIDLNYKIDGLNLLIVCVLKNDLESVKFLLKNGANINETFDKVEASPGCTPIILAVRIGSLYITKELLKYNPDLTIKDKSGKTVLDYAVEKDVPSLYKLFYKDDKYDNYYEDYNLNDQFVHTVMDCDFNKAKELLKLGANINYSYPEHNENLLITGASNCSIEIVKFMLENGVNANISNDNKYAIVGAINVGSLDIVKLLVENGANVNINFGAQNNTPLIAAVYKKQYEIVEYLIDKGANINGHNNDGNTAITTALQINNKKMLQILLKNNTKITKNIIPGVNIPLLHYCIYLAKDISNPIEDMLGIIELLLKNGVNVNQTNYEGVTPIYMAADSNNKKIFELLLKYGADPSIEDEDGNSAIDILKYQENDELLELI